MQNVQFPVLFFETCLRHLLKGKQFCNFCVHKSNNKGSISKVCNVLIGSQSLVRTVTALGAYSLHAGFMLYLVIADGPAIEKSLKFYFMVSKNIKLIV